MFTTIIIGLLAGFLAGKFIQGSGFGFWGNLLVGLIGSFVGSWAFGFLSLPIDGLIAEIVASTVGAVIFLFIWRAITK